MSSGQPLVSIYSLTYNSSKTILETLESIYNLTYQNIELVLSDDASKDNTVEICRNWIGKHRERFVKTTLLTVPENTGISNNFHRAISACSGEWFKGISGDDALFPDSISELIAFANNHPDARMIHGDSMRYDTLLDDAHCTGIQKAKDLNVHKVSTAKQQFEILMCWPCIDAPAVFYHKSVFQIPELQNCGYSGLEDYPRFLRYTLLGNYIYGCDILICKYRQSATSVQRSSNYNNLITKCYLQHFFEESHCYYHGIESIARYGVNIFTWLQCYTRNKPLRKFLHFILYPAYWLAFKIKLHYDYKRINNALSQELCNE